MECVQKQYVHLPIDAVDSVVLDAEERFDPELHDRYATYAEARDAALSSIELTLDAQDYDGEDHREELERMLALLEGTSTFDELEAKPGYHWFIARLETLKRSAA
jgi:hypothetical protein